MSATDTQTLDGKLPPGEIPLARKLSHQSNVSFSKVETNDTDGTSSQQYRLNLSGPVSRSIGKKLRKKLEEKEAKKRIEHAASFRGWKEVTGYDSSYDLSSVDEIMDLLTRATTLDQYLPEFLYGDWYHGIAIIILSSFLSTILGKFKFSLGFVFLITLTAALYYRSSIRKYRLKLRLQTQKEFSVHKIEDDFESMDWLNVLLDKYWAFLEPSISQQITDIVNPMLAELDTIPAFIQELWIHSMTLGTKPPRIDKVRTLDRTGNDVTVMDWTFSMIPNALEDSTQKQMKNKVNQMILIKAKLFGFTIPVYVSDVSFKANAKVRLRMMENFPHIQTINVSLTETPDIDFIAKPAGGETIFGFELFAIPGLYLLVKEMIKKYVGPMLFSPLSFQLNLEQLLNGNGANGALGVLELNIKNARDLHGADTFNNTIDPYFTFGFTDEVLAKTKIVNDTINPDYNETLRIILNSSSEPLAIKLYDENLSDGRKDKFMGAALFDLEDLMSKQQLNNVSIPILRNNHPAGTINFDIKLMKSLQGSKLPDGSFSPPPDYNTGIAKIELIGARNFTENEEEKKSVYAQVYILSEKKLESKIVKNASSAKWNEKFEEVIYDRSKAKIRIILREKGKKVDEIIGSHTLRLVDIIDASYVGNPWFTMSSGVGEVGISCNWNSVKILGVPGAIGYNDPIGVLRVYIEKADGLINLEKIGVIDPYIRILINGIQRARTLTMQSTVNPKYYESLYIPISSVNQRVTIEGMDVERHGQDRTLGSFQLRLNEFIDYDDKGEAIETTSDMKTARLFHKRKGARGNVSYSLSFYPVSKMITPKELEREKEETEIMVKKIEEEENKDKDVKTEEDDENKKNDIHDAMTIKTQNVLHLENIPKYNSGVVIITFLGSNFTSTGYFQVFFDKRGHSAYETKVSPKVDLKATFDFLVKELQKYSVVTFRVAEKPNQNLLKTTGNEVTVSTHSFLENSYDKVTSMKVGENTIKLSSRFLPAQISKLPPADSIGNSGTLYLEIKRGFELLSKDSNGKSDPFVKLYLNGDEFYHTKTIKKTLEPEWNESTSINIDSRVQSILRVKCSDWDFGVEQDDKIGDYKFALKAIDPFVDKTIDYEIKLVSDDRAYAGTIVIGMRFEPEYHTIISAEKALPNASNLAVDGAGKLISTGASGTGKVLGVAGKIGGKALHGAGSIGGIFKKKHDKA